MEKKLFLALQALILACDNYAAKYPDIQNSNPQDEDWNKAYNEAKELLANTPSIQTYHG